MTFAGVTSAAVAGASRLVVDDIAWAAPAARIQDGLQAAKRLAPMLVALNIREEHLSKTPGATVGMLASDTKSGMAPRSAAHALFFTVGTPKVTAAGNGSSHVP